MGTYSAYTNSYRGKSRCREPVAQSAADNLDSRQT
jgi:hypothetical protein